MSENINAPQTKAADDEIDLRKLFNAIWRGKWIVIATTFVFAVLSVIYSLSLPNIYRSEALLAPITDDNSMKLPTQLGGLAALAGVNLSNNSMNKAVFAIATLESRDFIISFIEKHDLSPVIYAAEKWDSSSNRLVFNKRIYDESTSSWVGEDNDNKKPTKLSLFKSFSDRLYVGLSKETGLVNLSFEHVSPSEAKKILELLIKEINENIRKRDLDDADRSINYLKQEILSNPYSELNSPLYSLIEEKIKMKMLANIRAEYVFSSIDNPSLPEKKSKPSRFIIVLVFTFFGFFISLFLIAIRVFNAKVRA